MVHPTSPPRVARMFVASLVGAAAVVSLGACLSETFTMVNNGTQEVEVFLGDETVTVPESGAVEIMEYECTPGDVTVTIPDVAPIVLPGPICNDEEIIVWNEGATTAPAQEDPES